MGKQLEIPNGQGNVTLVPHIAARDDAVGVRLKTVYEGVPGETMTVCERHRIGMARDNLDYARWRASSVVAGAALEDSASEAS